MIEDIGADEYKIEENDKEYILRIGSNKNKINLNISTRDNQQFKNYAGEFTLDDLRRINRVFLLTKSIYEAKEEFKKAVERKKIAISERDDYIHTVFYMMIGTDTSTLSIALPRDETPRIIRLEQNLNILKLGRDNISDRLAVFEKEAEEIKKDLDRIQMGNSTLQQIADTIGQGIPDVSEIVREYKANKKNPNYTSYNHNLEQNNQRENPDMPYSSNKIKIMKEINHIHLIMLHNNNIILIIIKITIIMMISLIHLLVLIIIIIMMINLIHLLILIIIMMINLIHLLILIIIIMETSLIHLQIIKEQISSL